MTPVLRRVIPVLIAGLAMVDAGCGSKSAERTPTGPPASGEEGRFSAMAVAPSLGAADPFAVLGGSTVTNVVSAGTLVTGDLGVSPGNAVTGFPPGVVTGTIRVPPDPIPALAQASITAAFIALNQPCDLVLTGTDLGGLTLTPGTYCFSSSAQLTGTLTLNGLGNPGAVFIFRIGTTLTTASGSRVAFINGARACGVFFQVGSSATLGTNTNFAGNILAQASITLNTDANNNGGLFAQTGAVTLDSNLVSRVGSCGSGPQPVPTPFPVPALPRGAGLTLLVGLLGIGAYILSRH